MEEVKLPTKALENGQRFSFEHRKLVKYEVVAINEYVPPPPAVVVEEQSVCLNFLATWQQDDSVSLAELPGYLAEIRERKHLEKEMRREKVREAKKK